MAEIRLSPTYAHDLSKAKACYSFQTYNTGYIPDNYFVFAEYCHAPADKAHERYARNGAATYFRIIN